LKFEVQRRIEKHQTLKMPDGLHNAKVDVLPKIFGIGIHANFS